MTVVTNLLTGEQRTYSCAASTAVMCAYAQERGDWNTWEYENQYGELVCYAGPGGRTVYCGNWAATT